MSSTYKTFVTSNNQPAIIAIIASILLHIPILMIIAVMSKATPSTTTTNHSLATQLQLLQSLQELTAATEPTTTEEPKLQYQDTQAVNEATEQLDTNLFGAHTTKATSIEQNQQVGEDISQIGKDRPYKEILSTPLTLPQVPQEALPAVEQISLLEALNPTKPNQAQNEIIKKEASTNNSELLTNTYSNPEKTITIDKAKPKESSELETQISETPQEQQQYQLPTIETPLSLPNQQTQLDGLSNMSNQSSLEVNKSQLGEYGKKMSDLVELSWQKYTLENRQYIDPGVLRIRFKVNANGYTSDFEIIQIQGCNDVQKSVTIEAIKYCKLPPIPKELIQELGEDFFSVSYTFYY